MINFIEITIESPSTDHINLHKLIEKYSITTELVTFTDFTETIIIFNNENNNIYEIIEFLEAM